MSRYPKPDSQRVTRHKQAFEWQELPASGRRGPAPKLPALRAWSPLTRRWWRALWSLPQATMWEPSGETAVPMAVLYQDVQDAGPERSAGLLAELRQHQDRHGLSPKAMLQLRWRIVDADGGAEVEAPVEAPGDPGLRVVL